MSEASPELDTDLDTDLATALGANAARLDAALDARLARLDAPARLKAAMRHAVLAGGKRLRPFLVIECAGLFEVPAEAALPTAEALECLHTYSLVHDDLPAMDDDDLRRGAPTVHKAFDEATAILAGDALLTLAFAILAAEETHPEPAVRTALVVDLARAAGAAGMAGGQMLDLAYEREAPSAADIAAMQAMKTGALFRFAARAGGLLGASDADGLAGLDVYASAFGKAFQITDDLLDATGDAEAMGKAAGKDAGRGKATMVDRLGAKAARVEAGRLVAEAEAALAPYGARATLLRGLARHLVDRTS
jgi:farnesyl diphosphate synthase